MIGSRSDTGPVWTAPEPGGGPVAPLEGRAVADVVVIGAGFLGLIAALELAAAGKSVIVLDAGLPAANASAASAGQVGPMLLAGGKGPADVVRRLGEVQGTLFNRLLADSGRWLFELIERHDIDCEARRALVCVYRGKASLARAAAAFREWNVHGGRADPLTRSELSAHIRSERYEGGFLLPDGGLLNPARLVAGLTAAIRSHRGNVHFRSKVLAVERKAPGWIVRTAKGSVLAASVIVATGTVRHSPVKDLADNFYAAPCAVAATAPLEDRDASLLPLGGPVVDLDDKAVFAPAISADGRLLASYLAEREPPSLPRAGGPVARRFCRVFPDRSMPQFETLSWGRIAITPDGLPRLLRIDDGLLAIGGCNGFGLTLGAIAARQAAQLTLTGSDEGLALPVSASRRLTGARLAPRLFRSIAAPLANRLGA